jgi:hypothetical protein
VGRGARLIAWSQNLNFFASSQTNDSAHIRRIEILSTRVYIILGALVFIFIAFFTAVSEETTTVKIIFPSLDNVNRLQDQGYILTCQCSRITIQFASFVVLEPSFHQVRD